MPLANLLAALSSFLVAYLLVLLRKADSSGFRPKEEVVDFLPLLSCAKEIQNVTFDSTGSLVKMPQMLNTVVEIFYIIINHFLASEKWNMLNVFVLNVKS